MKAYTDYPIQGNESNKIIEVEVLAYDRNKYALVKCGEVEEEIKAGYLFSDTELTKRLSNFCMLSLPFEKSEKKPNRKEVYTYIKEQGKRKTQYFVWVDKTRYVHNDLTSAIRRFSQYYKEESCCIIKSQVKKYSSSSMGLIESEDGFLVIFQSRNGRCVFKNSHYKKLKNFMK